MPTIKQSPTFSILTPTFKSKMHPKFSIALCIQANQHMGHNEQAAKDARRQCFAILDFFGLNSLFISTTPDDKCSFRVRLYCKPHYWVSSRGKFQIGIVRFFCNLVLTTYSKMEYFVFSKVKYFVFFV